MLVKYADAPARTVTIQTEPISRDLRRPVDVEGWEIAPGLAITPVLQNESRYARFSLTHIGSGKVVCSDKCVEHIESAAEIALGCGIDWTGPESAVRRAVRDTGVWERVRRDLPSCFDTVTGRFRACPGEKVPADA